MKSGSTLNKIITINHGFWTKLVHCSYRWQEAFVSLGELPPTLFKDMAKITFINTWTIVPP